MSRQKKADNLFGWAICVNHPDGTCGWLMDNDLEVKTYPSQEDAEKALKQMKRNPHYSWSLSVEVKEFSGFSNKRG